MPSGEFVLCEEEPDCPNKYKNHRWGRPKDWFVSKVEQKAYCPEHIPVWVKRWREKQAGMSRQRK